MSTSEEAAFAADPKSYLESDGYLNVRQLPSGEWAGVLRMIFTWGLCVGMGAYQYRTRFCYETAEEASAALESWDGNGWPPGFWIKEKPSGVPNPARQERAAE